MFNYIVSDTKLGMYFWNSYPFVRFTIALIIGILAFDEAPYLWENDLLLVAILFALLSISSFISSKISFYRLRHVNGFLALIIICLLGGSASKLTNNHSTSHYLHMNEPIIGFSGRVDRPPN